MSSVHACCPNILEKFLNFIFRTIRKFVLKFFIRRLPMCCRINIDIKSMVPLSMLNYLFFAAGVMLSFLHYFYQEGNIFPHIQYFTK